MERILDNPEKNLEIMIEINIRLTQKALELETENKKLKDALREALK